jgi:hypothetical protein|tara:strand:- start:4381 stop:4692 length:312 start_codon:yes stop_codon:yes gene_type:complete
MNVIRYNNFTEFYLDFKDDFSRSNNPKFAKWWMTIGNLNKGCKCSLKARMLECHNSYLDLGSLLEISHINLMRLKNPNTKYEITEDGLVFLIIPPTGPIQRGE